SAASTKAVREPARSAVSRMRLVIARGDVAALSTTGPAVPSPVLTPRSTRTSQMGVTAGGSWRDRDPPRRQPRLPVPHPSSGTGGRKVRAPPPPRASDRRTLWPRGPAAHAPNCVFRCAYCRARRPARRAYVQAATVRRGRSGDRLAWTCAGGRSGRRPVAAGPRGDLRAVGVAELGQDVGHVPGRGGRADHQFVGDLLVGQALGDQPRDLVLAPGERAGRAAPVQATRVGAGGAGRVG